MEIDHPKQRCGHEGCRCEVGADKQYCSEHCRKADQNPDPADPRIQGGACGCGHSECIDK
ncbi:MAG TPA: hypothetical protein VJ727_02900 [Rhodanobacteraceae bacterium]|nr:hypothetical protein [Rhodanobacteraceae bacterium]